MNGSESILDSRSVEHRSRMLTTERVEFSGMVPAEFSGTSRFPKGVLIQPFQHTGATIPMLMGRLGIRFKTVEVVITWVCDLAKGIRGR